MKSARKHYACWAIVAGISLLTPFRSAVGQRLGAVINEVFYDPPGTDTGFEWVELKNTGPTPVTLTGYDLKPDGAAYYTFPAFTLQPGAYVTVHINASGADTQTDLYAGASSNMGNTQASITLFTSTTHSVATIYDFMEYGAGGQTWESTAVSAGIWTVGAFAPDVDEGSSVGLCPDGADHDLGTDWQSMTATAGQANACGGPTATPTRTPTGTPSSAATLTPTTTQAASPTRTPTPPPITATSTTTPTPSPTPSCRVVINEVQYNPPGADSGLEWIELYNPCSQALDLSGYSLKPDDARYFDVPASTILPPGSYLVVHVNTDAPTAVPEAATKRRDRVCIELYGGSGTANMGNTSGAVSLYFSSTHDPAHIIDFVEWGAVGQPNEADAITAGIWLSGSFVPVCVEGCSTGLYPDGDTSHDPEDWSCQLPSSCLANSNAPCTTPTSTATPTSPPTLTRTPTLTPTSPPITNTPTLTPTGPAPTRTPTLTSTNTPVTTCRLVINEVNYNPTGADTGQEWVELYNPCSAAIDIGNYNIKPDDVRYYQFAAGTIVAPGDYVILYVNTDQPLASAARRADRVCQVFYQGSGSSGMGNSSGAVSLYVSAAHDPGNIIDFVEWGATGQPNEDDAIAAGIWPTGEFVPVCAEGCSTGLYPDGSDHNAIADWSCQPATGCGPNSSVPCTTPTPAATATPTITPTGSIIPPTATLTPTPTIPGTPPPCHIVINEVLNDPEGTDTGSEWIELYNPCSDAVSLTGYSIKPDDARYYNFPDGTEVQPGSYVLLHVNAAPPERGWGAFNRDCTELYDGGGTTNMGNTSGAVSLFNSATHSAATIIDFVEWGAIGQPGESWAIPAQIWTAGTFVTACAEGCSLGLYPDGADHNVVGDWSCQNPNGCQSNSNTGCGAPATPSATPTPIGPSATPTTTGTPATATITPTATGTPIFCCVEIVEVMANAIDKFTGQFIEIINCGDDPMSVSSACLVIGEGITSISDALVPFSEGGSSVLPPHGRGIILDQNYLGQYDDTMCAETVRFKLAQHEIGQEIQLFSPIYLYDHPCQNLVSSYRYPVVTDNGQSAEKTEECAGDSPSVWIASACSLRQSGYHSAGRSNCTSMSAPAPRPYVLAAGFDESYIESSGGSLHVIAAAWDPLGRDMTVTLFYEGTEAVQLGRTGNPSFFESWFDLPGGLVPGVYAIDIQARTSDGTVSDFWPEFVVRAPEPVCASNRAAAGQVHEILANFWQVLSHSSPDIGSSPQGPFIRAAGYMDTDLDSLERGRFQMCAVVSSPNGASCISSVEIQVASAPTGVFLPLIDYIDDDSIYCCLDETIDPVASRMHPGRYELSLVATDCFGDRSDIWPHLVFHR